MKKTRLREGGVRGANGSMCTCAACRADDAYASLSVALSATGYTSRLIARHAGVVPTIRPVAREESAVGLGLMGSGGRVESRPALWIRCQIWRREWDSNPR